MALKKIHHVEIVIEIASVMKVHILENLGGREKESKLFFFRKKSQIVHESKSIAYAVCNCNFE